MYARSVPIDIISTRISSLRRRAANAAATPDTNVAKAGVSVRNQMCDNCLELGFFKWSLGLSELT